jgi:hypothetical protein
MLLVPLLVLGLGWDRRGVTPYRILNFYFWISFSDASQFLTLAWVSRKLKWSPAYFSFWPKISESPPFYFLNWHHTTHKH